MIPLGQVSPDLSVVAIQLVSHVQLFETPWTAPGQASLSFIISWSCSDSFLLSQWCHPTISFSAAHVSCCLQSFPASGSFSMSQLFASDGQSTWNSASAINLTWYAWLIRLVYTPAGKSQNAISATFLNIIEHIFDKETNKVQLKFIFSDVVFCFPSLH